MGHTVGDTAARSVAKGQAKKVQAERTVEERKADIRKNIAGSLSVPNTEVQFLLDLLDRQAKLDIAETKDNIQILELQRVVAIQSAELKAHTETIATLLAAVKRYENGLSANKPSAEVVGPTGLPYSDGSNDITEPVDAFETPKFDASTEEPNTR